MNKRKKIFLLLAGSLGLLFIASLILYLSAARLINTETIKGKIHAYLLEKTGAHIAYETSEFHLLPLPEIIFHKVSISAPGKAEGSAESLRVNPGLWSLIKGDAGIAKISLEAPHFTVAVFREREKLSLELIEKKLRTVVRYIVTTTPGLILIIRDGRLDLTEENEITFSFDLIQSRLSASRNTLEIELNSRSNLWDGLSLSASIAADDLESRGAVRFTHLRPDILIARLSKETAGQMRISEVDLSVKFETLGLRVVRASMESSVSGLAVSRGKRHASLGDGNVRGGISIEPGALSVHIDEAKISRPALNVSGQYTLDRDSGIMTVDLEGRSITVQPVRESALDLGGDIPLIETIFTYVRGGEIPALHIHANGKSLAELGRAENIRVSGNMRAGTVYVKTRDLMFQNVTGDVVVSGGVLDASSVGASLENHRCSGGKLRIGLKGEDAPFHLDLRVKADAGQLPSLLKNKGLVKNEALLHEMERIHDLRGGVEGRLILGDRLDAVRVEIAVDTMNIMARYEPLPFPLAIAGGKFFFDEKTLGVADSEGSIGGSSFSGLTAKLSLADPYDLEVTGGQLSISADEIYPWITSFEKIMPVLKDVRSVQGIVEVSSMNLRGPLYEPGAWQFRAAGEATRLTLDAAFLPGKAEDMSGTFGITQGELSLKNVRAKLIDSLLTVSGVIREFPSEIRTIDLSLEGEIGPKVIEWISALVHLPPEIKIRAPISATAATLFIEKERETAFRGRLLFAQGTEMSLAVTITPESTAISDLTVRGRSSDFSAAVKITRETIDSTFKGILTPQTLNTILADSIFSGSSLEGDFRNHIVIEQPRQSTAEGTLKGNNIPIPWGRDIPLMVQHFEIEAEERGVVIKTAELRAGDMKLTARGTTSRLPSWFSVDLDLSTNGIEWATFERILRGRDHAAERKKTGFLKDLPIRGNVRVRSDFFRYGRFQWDSVYADISFDGETVLITAKKAALCGVSTIGSVGITEEGLKLDVTLSAKDLAFRPAILCITNQHADYTGTFQMDAHLKGEGTFDQIADRLEGTFTLSAKDGTILKSRSLDKTFDLLNESENFKGQFPDLDKEIISYDAVEARGSLRDQKLQIDEGIIEASIMEIMARGHLDLREETVDINALVAPLKTVHRIVRKIPILGHILGGNLLSIPVKISGDIKDPRVTFLSPSAIGSEVLGIVERTLKLPITLVEPVFSRGKEK